MVELAVLLAGNCESCSPTHIKDTTISQTTQLSLHDALMLFNFKDMISGLFAIK